MSRLAELLGTVGIGIGQLRHRPGRTTLAVVGAALAVVRLSVWQFGE